MSRTHQSYWTPTRRLRSIYVWVLVAASMACTDVRERPVEVDLIAMLPQALVRPAPDAASVDVATFDADGRLALVLRPPARVTWTMRLPHSAIFRTAIAGSGQVRIGISDNRTYEELARVTSTAAWTDVSVDLSEYSEWKLSVFFQPLRHDWGVVISADPTAGDQPVALARPLITKS